MNEPTILYRDGLSVLLHVREQPPSWMTRDERADGWVAPGHRLPDLRRWAAARGIDERTPDPDELAARFTTRAPRGRISARRWTGGAPPTGGARWSSRRARARPSWPSWPPTRRDAAPAWCPPTKALVHQWFGQLADAFGADRVGAARR